jgi:hypothetical protein
VLPIGVGFGGGFEVALVLLEYSDRSWEISGDTLACGGVRILAGEPFELVCGALPKREWRSGQDFIAGRLARAHLLQGAP